jgi:hypothetical protein
MTAQDIERLRPFATRYVWWKTAEEALRYPERLVAQVMNIGSFADLQRLDEMVGEEELRLVLSQAEAGQFTPRSWHYWHYRLGLCRPGEVPPLPIRKTG